MFSIPKIITVVFSSIFICCLLLPVQVLSQGITETPTQPQTTQQAQPAPLQLGVRVIEPFVTKSSDGTYSGFSVELWDKISTKAELGKPTFTEYKNVGDLLQGVQDKKVDAGIAAISITSDRESKVDFSQPMFNAGLQIMVPKNSSSDSSQTNIFQKIATALWRVEFLNLVISIIVLSFVLANIIYLVERRHLDGVFSKNYFVGIWQAFWWSLSGLASQADHNPVSGWGKGIAVVWMYFSVIFITFFQAGITSDFTAAKLQGSINGVNDLPGKSVISIKSSTASKYLDSIKVDHKDYDNLKDALAVIQSSGADALVYDAPPLAYYSTHEGNGKVELVGEIFKPENYGIALQQGSSLTKKINLALLSLKEDGTYDELYTKYFGTK